VTDRKPTVSVVIPAYREAPRIGPSVRECLDYFDALGMPVEVIVADDGSDDETAAVVERESARDPRVRLVRLGMHKGKGAAVRAGIAASSGAQVLLVDADLAIPLSEYPHFAEALRNYDLALASKELGRRMGFVQQPFLRVVMGRIFNLAVRLLLLPGFLDTQAGFKLLRGDAARLLASECEIDGFAYDVEMLALALAHCLRAKELPIHCRLTGKTSVRVFRDSLRMLQDIWAVRRRMQRRTCRPTCPPKL
jgi:dolichyl-phosphate beta-glucosyltransferase